MAGKRLAIQCQRTWQKCLLTMSTCERCVGKSIQLLHCCYTDESCYNESRYDRLSIRQYFHRHVHTYTHVRTLVDVLQHREYKRTAPRRGRVTINQKGKKTTVIHQITPFDACMCVFALLLALHVLCQAHWSSESYMDYAMLFELVKKLCNASSSNIHACFCLYH